MKTKQEIEQLIYGCFGKKEWDNVSTNAKLSLIETYTQCQEDNQDKKYTEKDIIWAIQEAYGHGRDEADDILFQQVEESIRVILKSLNKQD